MAVGPLLDVSSQRARTRMAGFPGNTRAARPSALSRNGSAGDSLSDRQRAAWNRARLLNLNAWSRLLSAECASPCPLAEPRVYAAVVCASSPDCAA